MGEYPHLLSPLKIGDVEVRNRVLQTAHVKMFSERGRDSQRSLDYQVARAKGGAGLLIDGNRLIHPSSAGANPRLLTWAHARTGIAVDRRMTAAVHEHGARIFAQLNHYGAQGTSEAADDLRVTVAPSARRAPATGESPKALEQREIRELIDWWGRSAVCSRDGGFDGVEIHIAHSYLLHEFLSPLYNRRSDRYGGSFENRLRFPREVLEEVRRVVGRDYVVGIRLVVDEFVDGGLVVDDAVRAACDLHAAVGLDFVNVSAAGHHNIQWAMGTADVEDGWLVERIAEFKRRIPEGLPVFVVGGIRDAAQAEEIVAAGKADMVAMTRAQIADPELVAKVRGGREDEVYHCVRINQGCIAHTVHGLPIGCTVNPVTGREGKFGGPLPPADPPREWLVIGGGPAGMKAAETLAKRGHAVTLLEREEQLGGQTRLSARTPGRASLAWIARDLAVQMRRHGVRIELGVEATVERVRAAAPHGVIVATGAVPDTTGFSSVAPLVERIDGIDGTRGAKVLTVFDVLLERAQIGRRVVVLDDDGGRYAAGPAELLLDRGHEVEVVSRWHALFPATVATFDMAVLYERLFSKGLTYRLNSWARRLDGDRLVVYELHGGRETTLEGVDAVVLATGPHADERLYLALREAGIANVHRVGDCVAPRRLDHAIYEGYIAGRELFTTEQRYIGDDELYGPPPAEFAIGAPSAPTTVGAR